MTERRIHVFIWRYGGQQVYLTGEWDDWTGNTMCMQYDTEYEVFRAVVLLDSSVDWQFKFIVDGTWRCSLDYATITDSVGNVNNVLYGEQSD